MWVWEIAGCGYFGGGGKGYPTPEIFLTKKCYLSHFSPIFEAIIALFIVICFNCIGLVWINAVVLTSKISRFIVRKCSACICKSRQITANAKIHGRQDRWPIRELREFVFRSSLKITSQWSYTRDRAATIQLLFTVVYCRPSLFWLCCVKHPCFWSRQAV